MSYNQSEGPTTTLSGYPLPDSDILEWLGAYVVAFARLENFMMHWVLGLDNIKPGNDEYGPTVAAKGKRLVRYLDKSLKNA